MLSDIVPALVCPVCGSDLALADRVLACPSGHAFDVARQGYVNLLTGKGAASTADTTEMVAARREFLDAGHYARIAEAIVDAATDSITGADGVFLDAGAGTGYYLASLLDAFPQHAGIALDISKHAARVAARSHERVGAIVADVWAPLPLRDGCAALVLVVFSPRNAEEFARVLAPGGMLIVVTPNPEHLIELVGPLGLITVDPLKRERLSAKVGPLFEAVNEREITYQLTLDRDGAHAAVSMGPSAAHVSEEELSTRMQSIPEPVDVTVSVTVGTYRCRTPGTADA